MIKRVCLVGPVHPYRGGIAHHTSMLAHELAPDHDVLVINFKRLYPSFLFPGKTQLDESGEPLQADDVRVIDSMNPLSFWSAAREIRTFKPDAVLFQWWHPFFAIAYASILFLIRRSSAAVVFLCHNVLPHESSPLDRILFRIAFQRVSRFMVHSQEDRSNLLALKKDARVIVHPLPLFDAFPKGRYDRQSARESLEVDGRVILFFGLIRAYKGLEVLLEAFAKVVTRIESTLLVVGEFYDKKDSYASQIDRLDIGRHVRVIDSYVPNEDVEKFFAACDVVALPYHTATQSAIVQVAFHFGKPVIVTSVGGLPDVVDDGHTGFVVPPGDPEALAAAIVRFFEEGRAAGMEGAVETAKDRFSWGRCKKALLELAAGRS
jgi:glycosyltransferase involved in cell wall biosynthesis